MDSEPVDNFPYDGMNTCELCGNMFMLELHGLLVLIDKRDVGKTLCALCEPCVKAVEDTAAGFRAAGAPP